MSGYLFGFLLVLFLSSGNYFGGDQEALGVGLLATIAVCWTASDCTRRIIKAMENR